MDSSPFPTARARSLAWPAAVALLATAPLLAVLASGRTTVWRDTARLFAPIRALVVEALRDGRLPAWNPYEGLGMPLFAQAMHSILHPVSVAAALVLPGAGLDPLIVAHVALAAVGAYLLTRELGASAPGAALSGLAFGLSGYVLSMSSVLLYLAAAGTAPWVVAGILAAGRGRRHGVVAAALATGALCLAGDPQWLLVATVLGLGLAWTQGGARSAGRAVLGVALGTALGAVQLVPSWAYFRETTRSLHLDDLDRAQWALAPARIPELVLPGLFFGRPGEGTAPVFTWLGGPSSFQMPFVPGVVVGGAVLWLAVAGARASRGSRFLAASALALLWIALGTRLGATQLLQGVPVWGAFRYSEKMVGPLTLCLAVLAGLGADRAATGRRPAIAAGAVAAGLALLAVAFLAVPATEDALRAAGADAAVAAEARHRLVVGLAQAAGGMVLLAGAFAASGARRAWFPALAALTVGASGLAAAPLSLYAGERVAHDESILGPIRASDPFARISVPVPPHRGPESLGHWASLEWMESRMGMPSFSTSARVANLDAYSGILPTRYMLAAGAFADRFGTRSIQAFRRLGLTHVVLAEPTDDREADLARTAVDLGRLIVRDPEWGISAWEVPHRPWASFAPGAVSAPGQVEATRLLLDRIASGSPEVVVEGPLPASFSTGRVLRAEREAERVRIEAESSGPGLLVVNDAWSEGWLATVDGVPAPVLPADVVARAVAWPPGRHALEMRYVAPGLRLGGWISGLALLAVVALLVVPSARRRRPSSG